MPRTTRDTIKTMVKTVINRLATEEVIEFGSEQRHEIVSELLHPLEGAILTDEHLHEMTLEKLGKVEGDMNDEAFTESERYRTAKSMIRKDLGDDVLHGMYFQKSIKAVADIFVNYFMQSDRIEEVFESDEEVEQRIVKIVQNFDPKNIH
jgi:hypothetical protein